MKRQSKRIELIYKYVPDKYSGQKLNEIYSMIFNEIKELIVNENKYVQSKTN